MDNIKKLNKKKILMLSLIGALLFVIIISGASYAFFTTQLAGKDYVVYTGNLQIQYEKVSNVINLQDTYPLTNEQGLNTPAHTFKIKNTGSLEEKYQVRLELSDDTNLPVEFIKVAINKNGNEYLKPTLLSHLNSNLVVIDDGLLNPNLFDTYDLRLWVDFGADNTVIGKTFKAKIVVDALQNVADGYNIATAPIITLNDSDIHLNINDTYTEPGIKEIKDDKDVFAVTDATLSYEYYDGTNLTTVNSIDTTRTGVYYVTYSVQDTDNLIGKAVRVVTINNPGTIPTVTLNGQSTMTVALNSTYTEPGVTVDSGVQVATIGEVKTNVIGTYIIRYIAINAEGKMNSVTRTINVAEIYTIKQLVLANNVLITNNPDTYEYEPSVLTYTDTNFNNNELSSSSITGTKYFRYADSYTFDPSTAKYTLVNSATCEYSTCYETLKNKYVTYAFGCASLNSNLCTNDTANTIYKVTSNTTSSRISYIKSSNEVNEIDTSKSGLYSYDVTNGYGGADGTTYYFRGAIDNNYVSFANKLWRIIRINEDDTVRLILEDSIDENTYVYNLAESAAERNNENNVYYENSYVKTILDTWYDNNIGNNNLYASKVATGNYYCEEIKDEEWTRIDEFKCNDSYGSLDNYLLNDKIGLIVLDDLIRAGYSYGFSGTALKENYLHKEYNWWTMSGTGSAGEGYEVYTVTGGSGAGFLGDYIFFDMRLRPVINLKTSVVATGNGTRNNPYTVIY